MNFCTIRHPVCKLCIHGAPQFHRPLYSVRIGWKNYFWKQLHCHSSPAALRHRSPVDTVVSNKLQPHSLFHLLCFWSNTLYEVLLEKLSLKEALLSQSHNSLQASMPQWMPHFAVVCCSLCVTDTVPLSVADSDDRKTRAFGSCWQESALKANTQSCLIQSPSTESWLKVGGL